MLFNKKYFLSLGILVGLTPAMQALNLFTSTETKLKKSVTVADVTTFTKELEAYKTSHDASTFKTLCSELNDQAQTHKKILQDELAALGEGKTVNAWQLAKGIGQTIIGSAAAMGVSSFATDWLFDKNTIKSFSYSYYKMSKYILNYTLTPLIIVAYLDPSLSSSITRAMMCIGSYSTILTITAYQGLKYGITNIKTGYNYRQYLEQQITNLDEIIKIIEVAQK
ncbi:MAG TPA: hypothetical protein PLU71_04545 [Candidatus Dependentiae bacterium]|nr:hypothetical protein [Candidatus Dependentiae bacterium]HRQ63102.1 hypothetical protein [Candidatus Dependentiae bacterium]